MFSSSNDRHSSSTSTVAASSTSSPLAQFEAAVQVVDSLPRGASGQAVAMQGFKPSTDLMLRFYALYKQAKFGPCQQLRPAFWDLVGKVKWDAWRALGDMSRESAMIEYSRQLRSVIESLPESSPAVSGLIDKVGSFYRLVDEQEAEPTTASAANDIKRGLLLANRIRYRSGSFEEQQGLDVNSNFLTQSLPPPMMTAAAASRKQSLGNGFVRTSQPDLRRDAAPPDWAAAAAAAAVSPDDDPGSGSDEDSSEDDEFCDSYDNFLHPDYYGNEDDDDGDVVEPPPGDVTGGGRQPSQSSSPSASAGSSGRRQSRHHQQHLQQQAVPLSNHGVGENGGLPWQQRQQPPPQPPSPGPQASSAAAGLDLERELVGQLRHIRASLDRLSGDLGRIHSRLDALEHGRSSLSAHSRGSFVWLQKLLFGGGRGGISVPALLLLLAWPVVVQLLWRLPWRRLRRRGRLAI